MLVVFYLLIHNILIIVNGINFQNIVCGFWEKCVFALHIGRAQFAIPHGRYLLDNVNYGNLRSASSIGRFVQG
jgi:hypothetical protein